MNENTYRYQDFNNVYILKNVYILYKNVCGNHAFSYRRLNMDQDKNDVSALF